MLQMLLPCLSQVRLCVRCSEWCTHSLETLTCVGVLDCKGSWPSVRRHSCFVLFPCQNYAVSLMGNVGGRERDIGFFSSVIWSFPSHLQVCTVSTCSIFEILRPLTQAFRMQQGCVPGGPRGVSLLFNASSVIVAEHHLRGWEAVIVFCLVLQIRAGVCQGVARGPYG